MTIGQRIKDERTKAKIGQSELAALCVMSRQQIHRLETGMDGRANPSLDTLVKIAKALGITVSRLVRGL